MVVAAAANETVRACSSTHAPTAAAVCEQTSGGCVVRATDRCDERRHSFRRTDSVLRMSKTRSRGIKTGVRDRRRVEAGTLGGLMLQGSWRLAGTIGGLAVAEPG
jgi:hypothetical protein